MRETAMGMKKYVAAPTAALTLGYIAHYDFGISRMEIRIPEVVGAVIIAFVIATPVTIDFFCGAAQSHRSPPQQS
jgi:hypothetical protein